MPCILVVDDEELIVTLTARALERAGYEAIPAKCATEALKVWRPDVDLLLTDCVMSDLFGDQLAAILLQRKPKLGVVYMSGNPMGALELSVPLEAGVNFLQKPFELADLLAIVQRALSAAAEKCPGPQTENSDQGGKNRPVTR